ncbi:hypothetical protein Ae201684_012909 [Aphanomyces euteiches]|uniref:Uncharacterized protein n=1 Tax=Aphanomyces euteiches TaxID=100861 RepID=A0A6G0WPW6_9STRA|nr:hypothetical protein Ae201684_012909 [Aphanomyces euteiches]
METPHLPTPEEASRLSETLRKRKYRAAKHNELVELERQARRLRAYLSQLKNEIGAQHLARAKDENLSLRTQVSQYYYLMQIFSLWVHVNENPQMDLSHQSTWSESTLLAHPITRRQGIQWLSKPRIHWTLRASCLSSNPIEVKLRWCFRLRRIYSTNDEGVTIAALETRYRHSLPTDFRSAAGGHWEKIVSTNSTVKMELIESVDDRFVYCHHLNNRVGTHLLSINGIFHEDNRAVVTHCYVANDELFPIEDGILRPHGFSWTIYEAVSSGLKLVHNFALQYTPIMANGRVLPLERIGWLFRQSPSGVIHRNAYIEQIRSAAEAGFVDSLKAVAYEMSTRDNES